MPPPEPPAEGGVRPRKIPPKKTVVEPAPSHDGAPCFTAYTVDAENMTRPQFALRIYDTTPAASSPDRTRDLALKIHQGTELERCDRAPAPNPASDRDRVEVVGLPLPQDASDEQRIQACTAHHMAEVSARRQHGQHDFYLPATFDALGWWRAIVVLDRLGEGWEGAALDRPRPEKGFTSELGMVLSNWAKTDPHGGFLQVRWDLTELARREMMDEEEPLPEVAVTPYPIWKLGQSLGSLREHMGEFRCFVRDGGLERDGTSGARLRPRWFLLLSRHWRAHPVCEPPVTVTSRLYAPGPLGECGPPSGNADKLTVYTGPAG